MFFNLIFFFLEIYILIAHYLKNGPLSQVGDVIKKDFIFKIF